jgi:hypothetical protein
MVLVINHVRDVAVVGAKPADLEHSWGGGLCRLLGELEPIAPANLNRNYQIATNPAPLFDPIAVWHRRWPLSCRFFERLLHNF